MFGFGKDKPTPPADTAASAPPSGQGDPYDRLLQILLAGVAGEKGVHVETALALLGGLTGFATQMAIREKIIRQGGTPENKVFNILKNGNETFYVSDHLHPPLRRVQQGHASLLSETTKAACALGAKENFDEKTYPELTKGIQIQHSPLVMLRDCWDTVDVYLKLNDQQSPLNWPFLLVGATCRFIPRLKGVIDPNLIVPIVMGVATQMSVRDPALICGQSAGEGKKTVDMSRTELGKFLQDGKLKAQLEEARAKNQGAGK